MEGINWFNISLLFIATLSVGIVIGLVGWKKLRAQYISSAKNEAQEISQEMKDYLEIKSLEEKERIQDIESELWSKVEKDFLKQEEKIEDLQELAEERKQKRDQFLKEEQSKLTQYEEIVKNLEKQNSVEEQRLNQKRNYTKELQKNFALKLCEKMNITFEQAKSQLALDIVTDTKNRASKFIEDTVEDFKEHSELRAKKILDLALDRFQRPYCAERGISSVYFPDALAKKLFTSHNGEILKAVTEVCGCDLIVENDMEMIGVAGYDPVRRELTRRTLERLMKEKRPYSPDHAKKIAENQKKELFRQIKSDGDALAKELKLENLNPEIRQMMGSLRYRYSFTQNQYFHCGEVGWLAGLLAAELNLDIKKARRSGMLHDIGKAMDHAKEGGHAIIGADFIQARGEAPDIVHNVRAHHYDEQPSTDHAFLIIAADAISGARPGARRSTVESYTQKVTELQDIAKSFEGVTDCFVLSGGRECRVMVNGKKVDDRAALDLSKKIAARIENELNYPGQIKVVVVRETLITESTMGKAHA